MVEVIFFNPWIWIVAIIIAILLTITIIGIVLAIRHGFDEYFGWSFASIFSGIFCLLIAGFYFGALLPPYDTDYYKAYRITGELTDIQSAFSGDEGTMSQTFVAEVDGVDHTIQSTDQRLRTFKVGDDVNLVCDLTFRYFQEPWYSCDLGSIN